MTTRSASRDASIRANAPVPAATTGTISAPFGATPVPSVACVDGAAQPGVVLGDLLVGLEAGLARPGRRRRRARSRRGTPRPASTPGSRSAQRSAAIERSSGSSCSSALVDADHDGGAPGSAQLAAHDDDRRVVWWMT